jgi:hypothetical protein
MIVMFVAILLPLQLAAEEIFDPSQHRIPNDDVDIINYIVGGIFSDLHDGAIHMSTKQNCVTYFIDCQFIRCHATNSSGGAVSVSYNDPADLEFRNVYASECTAVRGSFAECFCHSSNELMFVTLTDTGIHSCCASDRAGVSLAGDWRHITLNGCNFTRNGDTEKASAVWIQNHLPGDKSVHRLILYKGKGECSWESHRLPIDSLIAFNNEHSEAVLFNQDREGLSINITRGLFKENKGHLFSGERFILYECQTDVPLDSENASISFGVNCFINTYVAYQYPEPTFEATESSKKKKLSCGKIAAIVISVIAGVAIIAVVAVFVIKRRADKQKEERGPEHEAEGLVDAGNRQAEPTPRERSSESEVSP